MDYYRAGVVDPLEQKDWPHPFRLFNRRGLRESETGILACYLFTICLTFIVHFHSMIALMCLPINEDVRPMQVAMTENFSVVRNVQHSSSKGVVGIAQ